jgi:ergothioneine biosynthesis protein EgtB
LRPSSRASARTIDVAPSTDELAARFVEVRKTTEALVAPLSVEDMLLQSMPDASPAKWHLAHTTWFFEAFVLAAAGEAPFDPAGNHLWNSYYDAVGARHARAERGLLTRPSLDEVRRYRAHVDARVLARLRDGVGGDAERAVVELGTHHEQQHQELILTDVLHGLSRNPTRPAYRAVERGEAARARPLRFVPFEEEIVEVGHRGTGFAFDNETPRHRALVLAFELADRCSTNEELGRFVDDGGYERPDLWLSEGFALAQAEGWRAPLYWERAEGAWHAFTLGGLAPLDLAAPACHLSYFEADAFARWSGARLPTEFEWERAAQAAAVDGNLLESGALAPRAIAATPPSRVAIGAAREGAIDQLFGDVWEWTSSAYLPYPGFRPLAGALGEYNGKFMVNQQVLRGGSFATSRSHVRATYRNFFPARARWQFSGVRLAR